LALNTQGSPITKPDEVGEILTLYHFLVPLPRLQSEIKVTLFLFASRSFLANNLHFKVKLIDKGIVINVKNENT